MNLHDLHPAAGSTKTRKCKGRGVGTGNGKTGGRGHKGQHARSGGKTRVGFEGGQMPLVRRLPKRGFNNIFAKNYAELNVGQLNVLENGTEVTFETLLAAGLVGKKYDGVRILGKGELEKKLTVKVAGVSASAKEKIVAAGGEVI